MVKITYPLNSFEIYNLINTIHSSQSKIHKIEYIDYNNSNVYFNNYISYSSIIKELKLIRIIENKLYMHETHNYCLIKKEIIINESDMFDLLNFINQYCPHLSRFYQDFIKENEFPLQIEIHIQIDINYINKYKDIDFINILDYNLNLDVIKQLYSMIYLISYLHNNKPNIIVISLDDIINNDILNKIKSFNQLIDLYNKQINLDINSNVDKYSFQIFKTNIFRSRTTVLYCELNDLKFLTMISKLFKGDIVL